MQKGRGTPRWGSDPWDRVRPEPSSRASQGGKGQGWQRKQQAQPGPRYWEQSWQPGSLQLSQLPPEQNCREGEGLSPSPAQFQAWCDTTTAGTRQNGVHVSWERIPQAGVLRTPMAPAGCQAQGHLERSTLPALAPPGDPTPPAKSFVLQSREPALLWEHQPSPSTPKNRQWPWSYRKDRCHRATAPAQAPAFKNPQFT